MNITAHYRSICILITGIIMALFMISKGVASTLDLKTPEMFLGDTWTHQLTKDKKRYSIKTTVTGESLINNKTCHIVTIDISPEMDGIGQMIMYIDKKTTEPVRMTCKGRIKFPPASFTLETKFSYESSQPFYPLKTGKTFTVRETETTTFTGMGISETEAETDHLSYVVKPIEMITVQAGTFKCYRVECYSMSGELIETSWFSESVGSEPVRTVNIPEDEELVLTSFKKSTIKTSE